MKDSEHDDSKRRRGGEDRRRKPWEWLCYRMGCRKVKDGEHGGSERHQGKGDDVGDIGGVGGVDESLEMASVVQKGCGKVNDGETAPAVP